MRVKERRIGGRPGGKKSKGEGRWRVRVANARYLDIDFNFWLGYFQWYGQVSRICQTSSFVIVCAGYF